MGPSATNRPLKTKPKELHHENSEKMMIVVAVAAVTTLTGCSSIVDLNARGQALYAKDPAAYEKITGQANYTSVTPENFVHGS